MQIKIALCDDEPIQVELIKSYVRSMEVEFKVEYIEANSGEELLEKIKGEKVDIFFLDIQMSGLNGVETAKEIRENDNEAIIVFMTGFKKYALEAFELNAFHYLIKPIMIDKFRNMMKKISKRLSEIKAHREKTKKFTIKKKDEIIRIEYDDIYYFEKNFRKIKVYTEKGNYDFYGSIKALLIELDEKTFIRCHQGFVINKNKIGSYKNGELLLGMENRKVIVSRKYKTDVIRAIESILL
ncbi:MAG: LytR/AlgR family response regulator transcription factor [Alkaliphilus sp.]